VVAATAHPKTRPSCAGVNPICCASRAAPTQPAIAHGSVTLPPTPAANQCAAGAARSSQRSESARARSESELCLWRQSFVSVVTKRAARVYLCRPPRRYVTGAQRNKGQKRRDCAKGQRVELTDVYQDACQ